MDKNKEILTGNEARLRIKAGIDKAAAYVAPTLGAVGLSAIIEFPGLDPIEADDGVTILKNLKFKDPYEQFGLQKLRKGAIRTSTEGKDGTATTTVLTQALVSEAFKEISGDSSKIREVKERLATGLRETITALSQVKREVSLEEIEKVANTSSLDPEVSKIISEIIREVGVSGVVTVEKGAKLGYTKEVVKGAKFDKGLISPYFINDQGTQSTILEDVYICLIDRKVSTNEQVISLLNSIGTGKDILFIADAIDSVALGTLTFNAQQKIADIAGVCNPYTGSRARDFLFDIAALTGGTVISEEMGMKLNEADVKLCGRAEKVIVTRDHTIIIGGKSGEALQTRIRGIEDEIESTTSDYSKLMLQDRLACLTGGIGVIRVGAYTDTEFNAKKYKFDNAISSTQLALQEGIVAGGGSALAKLKVSEPMFQNILEVPLKQMAINAGMNWWKVVDYVQSGSFHKLIPIEIKGDTTTSQVIPVFGEETKSYGCDFKTKDYVDMFEAGIIDPFKTLRLALEAATNCAMSLIDKEVAITNEIDDKKI